MQHLKLTGEILDHVCFLLRLFRQRNMESETYLLTKRQKAYYSLGCGHIEKIEFLYYP